MTVLLAVGIPVLYIFLACVSYRIALVRQYARQFPDKLREVEDRNYYYNESSAQMRRRAHNYASEPDEETVMAGVFWPLALIFVIGRWLVQHTVKLAIGNSFERIQASVETSSERKAREKAEKEAESVVTNWSPPND